VRGAVVPLTPAQVLSRALYLAGKLTADKLDPFVRAPRARCRPIYYRLPNHNGGTDPLACDPASEWYETDAAGVAHLRVTSDCSGGDSWIHGHDRYQPLRMAAAVGYGGYFNTNSKIIDATRIVIPGSTPRCFEADDRPFLGAIIVCKSGSRGHDVGHEETVIEVPAEWDPTERACWEAIKTSGIRGSGAQANGVGTGRGWFDTDALFLRSVMQP